MNTPLSRVLVVSPALNEMHILPAFLNAFLEVKEREKNETEFRLLIVDDGSTDSTIQIVQGYLEKFPNTFAYLSFPSNFGHQKALIAGLMNIGSWPEAVITMDSDLEHPIDLLPELCRHWKEDRSVIVNTIREEHEKLGFLKRLFSKLYYFSTAKLTGLDLGVGQADFRLWDAEILRAVEKQLPNVGSLRVFAAWMPGKKSFVSYRQNVAEGRTSRFTFKKNVEFWKTGVVRYSDLPLRVIALSGMLGLLFAFTYGIYIVYNYSQGKTTQGWSSIILTVLFMGCIQLISIGILASYLNRLVFSKDLPLFIVRERSIPWER